jgi:hypothetical protein
MKKLRTYLLAALIVAGMVVYTRQANAVVAVAAHPVVVAAHPVVVAHPVEVVTAHPVAAPHIAEPVVAPRAVVTPVIVPPHHCDKSKEKCQ